MPAKHVPDFIIAGAPKCGTTALSQYLGQSSEIFIPSIKEPHFFCEDFGAFRRVSKDSEYQRLFENAEASQKTGDASVWYLYSREAAAKAAHYAPNAKVIIMFRNPVEMLPSLHFQLKFSGREDTETISDAWNLIGERKAGNRLPSNVVEPSHLFYDEVCNYWSQLRRWRAVFPDDKILAIDFDEFRSDPDAVTRRVFSFLCIDPPAHLDTNPVNEARAHRFPKFAAFLRHPPFPLNRLKGAIKRNHWVRANTPLRGLYAAMSRKQKPQPLSEALHREVSERYASEMDAMRAYVRGSVR